MSIIFAIILLMLYYLEIYSDARWDAEAFTEGESNHLYKSLRIMSWSMICLTFAFIGRLLIDDQRWFIKIGFIDLCS